MREIKFRAYGNYPYKMFIPKEIIIAGDSIHSVYDEEGNRYVPEIPLMQYTGLKDKNGVEIYEGDILSINQIGVGEDNIKEVYFANGGFYIAGRWSLWEILSKNKKFKVIGNKYENEELLNEAS